MSSRIPYFDFLRGVAILMVIGIHSYHEVPFDTIGNVFSNVIRQILNCSVPLFLAISGFFIGQKKIESVYDFVSFLRKQIPRVYIPLLVWSAPIIIYKIASGDNWSVAILKGMVGSAFGPYYFVILIIQLYILHPLIVRATNNKMGGVF